MELFEKLSLEKQRLIMNAAYACFGKSGYKKASIADIATIAGISKASLFQYFGTKKELYLFLYRYAMGVIMAATDVGTDDFFETIQLATDAKMYIVSEHPGMFEFLTAAAVETDEEVSAELKELNAMGFSEGRTVLFAQIDWSKFKPDLTQEVIYNMVNWINDGFVRSVRGREDIENMKTESRRYMELLKSALYREGAL